MNSPVERLVQLARCEGKGKPVSLPGDAAEMADLRAALDAAWALGAHTEALLHICDRGGPVRPAADHCCSNPDAVCDMDCVDAAHDATAMFKARDALAVFHAARAALDRKEQ